MGKIYRYRKVIVSIHAPARGATARRPQPARHPPVSIHAPARGATAILEEWIKDPTFQSTPPRGGRPRTVLCSLSLRSFNPRPRAGGDRNIPSPRSTPVVSIHAPARGATKLDAAYGDGIKVSIHAPARGATPPAWPKCGGNCRFNPRPRAGGDTRTTTHERSRRRFNPRPRAGGDPLLFGNQGAAPVSIHAPARGATAMHSGIFSTDMFQSTPPRGGRQPRASMMRREQLFQSTPPRGGRRSVTYPGEGVAFVSIHAPARGAT